MISASPVHGSNGRNQVFAVRCSGDVQCGEEWGRIYIFDIVAGSWQLSRLARPLRIEFEDALYHLCARGNDRQKVFRDDRDRARFLEVLERSCSRYQVSVLVFVLLSNHFHLVVQTHRANLSRWMHWLMVSYTVYFNWRHRRSGHLFQGRYKSFVVGEGNYLLELSRYVHLNPVRGKVLGQGGPGQRRQRLRDYKWSSYRGYAGLGKGYGFAEEELILAEVGGPVKGRRLRYRRFVEEGLLREIDSPWEAVQWQTVLGSESFVRKMQDRLKGLAKARPEVTALRRGRALIEPRELVKMVARHYQLPVERLVKGGSYGLEARNVAMWLVWEKCGMSLRQIGEFFGGLEYSAVAQRLRRLTPKAGKTARKLASQMSNINSADKPPVFWARSARENFF